MPLELFQWHLGHHTSSSTPPQPITSTMVAVEKNVVAPGLQALGVIAGQARLQKPPSSTFAALTEFARPPHASGAALSEPSGLQNDVPVSGPDANGFPSNAPHEVASRSPENHKWRGGIGRSGSRLRQREGP